MFNIGVPEGDIIDCFTIKRVTNSLSNPVTYEESKILETSLMGMQSIKA